MMMRFLYVILLLWFNILSSSFFIPVQWIDLKSVQYFKRCIPSHKPHNEMKLLLSIANLYAFFSIFSSADGAYEIADVDRKTFFTKAGRPVKDGGGNK